MDNLSILERYKPNVEAENAGYKLSKNAGEWIF